MATNPNAAIFDAALALHRFGMGPRPGSIASIAADPRGALIAEFERPGAGTLINPDLQTSGAAGRAMFSFQEQRREMRLAQRASGQPMQDASAVVTSTPATSMPTTSTPTTSANPPMPNKPMDAAGQTPQAGKNDPGVPQQIYLAEARARVDAALNCEIGFVERWVWFWSNHFCVSADKGAQVRALCGAYEREAIRQHAFGRFADMLLAVETHPAMLFYLDNVRSIGPQSIAGRNRGAGLNENLAREILELHTLGVRTVYTQTDVTSFAKVVTGWSIVPFKQDPATGGEFAFNARLHEPGAQTVVNKIYADDGFEQGRAVLTDIARHRATATHLARKLAAHFVSDKPPQALVDRLTARFLASDGDLKDMARTLITAKESWEAPREKLKRPSEWIIAALRATGVTPPDVRPVLQAQNTLGEPLWRPPAPKGFADDSTEWLSGLAERLDIANELARRVSTLVEPDAIVATALGPLTSAETRQTVQRAESRQQALALLLMAPEFQRR